MGPGLKGGEDDLRGDYPIERSKRWGFPNPPDSSKGRLDDPWEALFVRKVDLKHYMTAWEKLVECAPGRSYGISWLCFPQKYTVVLSGPHGFPRTLLYLFTFSRFPAAHERKRPSERGFEESSGKIPAWFRDR